MSKLMKKYQPGIYAWYYKWAYISLKPMLKAINSKIVSVTMLVKTYRFFRPQTFSYTHRAKHKWVQTLLRAGKEP